MGSTSFFLLLFLFSYFIDLLNMSIAQKCKRNKRVHNETASFPFPQPLVSLPQWLPHLQHSACPSRDTISIHKHLCIKKENSSYLCRIA